MEIIGLPVKNGLYKQSWKYPKVSLKTTCFSWNHVWEWFESPQKKKHLVTVLVTAITDGNGWTSHEKYPVLISTNIWKDPKLSLKKTNNQALQGYEHLNTYYIVKHFFSKVQLQTLNQHVMYMLVDNNLENIKALRQTITVFNHSNTRWRSACLPLEKQTYEIFPTFSLLLSCTPSLCWCVCWSVLEGQFPLRHMQPSTSPPARCRAKTVAGCHGDTWTQRRLMEQKAALAGPVCHSVCVLIQT